MAPTAGDERDWDEALAGIEASLAETTAICRHGNHMIHKDPAGGWQDDQGYHVCVKAPADQAGHGTVPDYIVHEPNLVVP